MDVSFLLRSLFYDYPIPDKSGGYCAPKHPWVYRELSQHIFPRCLDLVVVIEECPFLIFGPGSAKSCNYVNTLSICCCVETSQL